MLKKEVLRRKDDFTAIYRKGRSIGERYIVIFYQKERSFLQQNGIFSKQKSRKQCREKQSQTAHEGKLPYLEG